MKNFFKAVLIILAVILAVKITFALLAATYKLIVWIVVGVGAFFASRSGSSDKQIASNSAKAPVASAADAEKAMDMSAFNEAMQRNQVVHNAFVKSTK